MGCGWCVFQIMQLNQSNQHHPVTWSLLFQRFILDGLNPGADEVYNLLITMLMKQKIRAIFMTRHTLLSPLNFIRCETVQIWCCQCKKCFGSSRSAKNFSRQFGLQTHCELHKSGIRLESLTGSWVKCTNCSYVQHMSRNYICSFKQVFVHIKFKQETNFNYAQELFLQNSFPYLKCKCFTGKFNVFFFRNTINK